MERKEQVGDVVRASATEEPAFFPNKSQDRGFEERTNNWPVLVLLLGKVTVGDFVFSHYRYSLCTLYSLLSLFFLFQGFRVRLPCNISDKCCKKKTEEE